jgi:hypothetical protein
VTGFRACEEVCRRQLSARSFSKIAATIALMVDRWQLNRFTGSSGPSSSGFFARRAPRHNGWHRIEKKDIEKCGRFIQFALAGTAIRRQLHESMTGHLLGGSGALEAGLTVVALRDQIAPPTINLDRQDEDNHLNFVPHAPMPLTISNAMTNSFGFGGTNASLMFSAVPPQ